MRQARQAVGCAKPAADAEVVHRQYVRAAQPEHQQHLHGPASDATHLRQARDDVLVGQLRECCGLGNHLRERLCGQIAQRGDLGKRKPRRAQPLRGCGQHHLRGRKCPLTAGVDQTSQDRVGGRAVELLVSDRLSQRLERMAILLGLEQAGTHRADQAAEDRIGLTQVREYVLTHGYLWQPGQ